MKIDEQSLGSALVLIATGRLDSTTAQTLDEAVTGRIPGSTAVVLDLKGIQYVSSAGLRVLLKAAKLAKANGSKLALAALTPPVQEVFDISGFSAIFEIHPDVKASIAAIS